VKGDRPEKKPPKICRYDRQPARTKATSAIKKKVESAKNICCGGEDLRASGKKVYQGGKGPWMRGDVT